MKFSFVLFRQEHLSQKKYIIDIVTDSSVPSDSAKEGEERQKARKKAKKLRARMNSRWCDHSLLSFFHLCLSLSSSVWLKGGVAACESFMSDTEMESRGDVHPGCPHSNTDELNLWPLSVIGEEKVRIDLLAPPHFHLLRAFLLIGCHNAAKTEGFSSVQ